MKKLAVIPIILILSIVYAEDVEVSLNYKEIVEPNDIVEINLKIKNMTDTHLWKCKASVDVELLGSEIEYFTILSEPNWDEKIQPRSSVNGDLRIKISSDANEMKLRIPVIVSGEKGGCPGGCTPFLNGPFYVEITVKNKGIEAFNYAESLYKEEKYEEAMKKYDEAKDYFLKYSDDKNAKICLTKAKSCEGYLKLNSGISYFDKGDLTNAKKEFEDAKSIFESIDYKDMANTCKDWIEKCTPEITTVPPTTTPSTSISTTSPPHTTVPSTTPPQKTNTKTVFLFLLLIAIAFLIAVTIKITKK